MGAQAIKSGAFEFLQKPYQNQQLLDAVNSALKICKSRTEALSRFEKFDSLSVREKEVLGFVSDGKTSKEIAQALQISPKTVEAHRASLLRKLGAKSTSSVIHMAYLAANQRCRECSRAPDYRGTMVDAAD